MDFASARKNGLVHFATSRIVLINVRIRVLAWTGNAFALKDTKQRIVVKD